MNEFYCYIYIAYIAKNYHKFKYDCIILYWQHFIMKAMIKNLAYFIHTLLKIYIEATSKYNFHHTTSFFITGNKIFISIK